LTDQGTLLGARREGDGHDSYDQQETNDRLAHLSCYLLSWRR
jgi:hypothetical protein